MGGGASVHKHRDNSDSSNTSSQHRRDSSSQKQSKSSGFQIRKRKQKESTQEVAVSLSRSHQGSMGKLERSMKAAILIQRWYRRYLARMEIRRRYTWNIFQSVEYAGEQDQMKLYNFFNALLTHIPKKEVGNAGSSAKCLQDTGSIDSSASGGSSSGATGCKSTNRVKLRKRKLFAGSATGVDLEDIPVESDYKGPHIKLPLTSENLVEVIEGFRNRKALHVRYVAMILKAAAAKLKTRPNIAEVSPCFGGLAGNIFICGDLHGKLDDLIVILHKTGLPSKENILVFNGDYVDRGKRSIEILLILLCCFLNNPESMYLNRGNHEDHIMNMRYGFIREVRLKYKVFAGKLLHMIDQVYRSLPLGTIIGERVLVVHGGISETTDLDIINKIDRSKYVSILRPPMDEEGRMIQLSDLYTSSANSSSEWRQVLDLLWSDPSSGNGCSPNTFRGGGSYFGADVTEKILKKHKLDLLVRSHECKREGYEFMHDDKCVTIFSASNYYEEGSNKGAYIKLIGDGKEPFQTQFIQFNAATPKLTNMTIRQRVGLVEASAIRELRARIQDRQEILLQTFSAYDPDKQGLISVNDWSAALEKATELKLPWRLLRPLVAELDKATGLVSYHSTFQEETTPPNDDVTVVDVLYRNKTSLESIFRIIDKDNSGYISMEEFSDACALLSTHLSSPIPQHQMAEMARSMDMNKDGKIDLNEFLETFRIVSSEHDGADESIEYEELED